MSADFNTGMYEDIGAGMLLERANDALEQVIKNIHDPNTEVDAKRKVTVTLEIQPIKTRDTVVYTVEAKATLAPPRKVSGTAFTKVFKDQGIFMEKNPDQMDIEEVIEPKEDKND